MEAFILCLDALATPIAGMINACLGEQAVHLFACLLGFVSIGLVSAVAVEANWVQHQHEYFKYTTCDVKTIIEIVKPFPQNVSNIIRTQGCYYYKDLSSELNIGEEPRQNPVTVGFCITFIILFVFLVLTAWKNAKKR